MEALFMKKGNIYKDIVYLALGYFLIVWAVQGVGFWRQQQETFSLQLRSQSELTETVVRELEKLPGLYGFMPTVSCKVTLKLEEYTMETVVTGIDLKSYPLEWKTAQREIRKGSAPNLFLGKESFQAFTDKNGNGPGKSQISEWISHYQELDIKLIQDSGQEAGGKISGILEEPSAGIYMDGKQQQEICGESARIMGGVLKIQGKRNMEEAKKILEGSGFLVE